MPLFLTICSGANVTVALLWPDLATVPYTWGVAVSAGLMAIISAIGDA